MYSLYFRDVGSLNLAQIGWLGSLSGVANMLARLPCGWITDRRGPRMAMVPAPPDDPFLFARLQPTDILRRVLLAVTHSFGAHSMSYEKPSHTLTQEELYRFADIGSRKVYNISLTDLADALVKAGKPMNEDLLVLLSILGALEEGSKSSSLSEETPQA